MPTSSNYPRPSGTLIPMALRRVGCAGPVDGPDDAATRHAAAAATLAWVKRSFRRLPPALLAIDLPSPATILQTWVIGQRTRGALDGMLSTPDGRAARTVAAYLRAARLGPHALVDLLAAREESQGPQRPTSGRRRLGRSVRQVQALDLAGRSDHVSAVIRGLLPLSPSELGAALVAAGVVAAALRFDDVVQAYKERDVPVPFRLVRRGGATVLVAPESISSTEALLSNAAHLVFNWGACTVNALVGRLQALTTLPLGIQAAARILRTIPRFRWLDEASGWFSFTGVNNRLGVAVRKIFAVAERVSLDDLSVALGKQIGLVASIPVRAIEAYLRDVVGCDIDDGWVRPRAPLAPAALGPSERALVEVLRQSGGHIATSTLRERTVRSGLTTTTLRHLLRTSPLLIEVAGSLRLIGAPLNLALA